MVQAKLKMKQRFYCIYNNAIHSSIHRVGCDEATLLHLAVLATSHCSTLASHDLLYAEAVHSGRRWLWHPPAEQAECHAGASGWLHTRHSRRGAGPVEVSADLQVGEVCGLGRRRRGRRTHRV